ncbi:hypothetical protein E2320_017391 [Naja naja]|nr:hypothetical protein E2320_017391 [Naja naja]
MAMLVSTDQETAKLKDILLWGKPTVAKRKTEKWMCMLILSGYLGRRNKVLEEKMSLYSSGAGFVASEGRGFTHGFPGEENLQAGSNIMMVIKKMTIGTKGTCL